jgi:hypothetical protein
MATVTRIVDEWERLPGETAKAYDAFRRFRDAGTTRHVSDFGPSARTWAAKFAWQERAAAWDAEAHRMEDTRRLEAIREMDDTHARAARVLITAGLAALAERPKLTPHQAARLIDLGTKLQRATLLGEHLEPAAPMPVAVDEELSPLERIARELAGIA